MGQSVSAAATATVGRGAPKARGRAPHDWAPVALEDERLCIKVPGDGTQRAQEVDAKDEVEATEVDADARDGVGRTCDGDLHTTSYPRARQAVTVGHRDLELVAPCHREAEPP
jgi:hypothetical protein